MKSKRSDHAKHLPDGITVNLFRDYAGNGPWLHVWSNSLTKAVANSGNGAVKLSPQVASETNFGIKLERALRDDFINAANKDYLSAVKWTLKRIAELNENNFRVTIVEVD